jgi:hypothetical protein
LPLVTRWPIYLKQGSAMITMIVTKWSQIQQTIASIKRDHMLIYWFSEWEMAMDIFRIDFKWMRKLIGGDATELNWGVGTREKGSDGRIYIKHERIIMTPRKSPSPNHTAWSMIEKLRCKSNIPLNNQKAVKLWSSTGFWVRGTISVVNFVIVQRPFKKLWLTRGSEFHLDATVHFNGGRFDAELRIAAGRWMPQSPGTETGLRVVGERLQYCDDSPISFDHHVERSHFLFA